LADLPGLRTTAEWEALSDAEVDVLGHSEDEGLGQDDQVKQKGPANRPAR
jgi:hypothetical protein